jgi:hypothetical protein
MVVLDVAPARGLGGFLLGMPLSEAIDCIKKLKSSISKVELQFNEQVKNYLFL